MVTAIVLVKARRDLINETAMRLAEVPGISEVYSVSSGEFDLVVVIRVADTDAMAEIVTGQMLKLEGIERTQTMVAFRAYSRHDLDRLFAIGTE
jgi:DNA-binding Lrp family transcriptional regulator